MLPVMSWNVRKRSVSFSCLLPCHPSSQDFASQQDHFLSLTADPSALQSQPSNDPSSYLFPSSNAFLSDLSSAGTQQQQQQQQLVSQVGRSVSLLIGGLVCWSVGQPINRLVSRLVEWGKCLCRIAVLKWNRYYMVQGCRVCHVTRTAILQR